MKPIFVGAAVAVAFLLVGAASASGQARVWTGDDYTFTKEPDSDWTSAAKQDRITDEVWITRGDKKGIFNIAKERGYKPSAPAGTEWAYGSAADWESLRFHSWETFNSRIPPNMVGEDAVLHLLEEDVYLDIKFLSWTEGGHTADGKGGGFSYTRATEGTPGEKVWTGSPITFTKQDYADWTQAANQDRITENVWITRADKYGIFNIAKERGYWLNPPSGTEWAYGTASNWASLDFVPLDDLNGGDPADMIDKDAVVHLIDDDVYIDVKLLSWTEDNLGGGFSYERATEGSAGEKVWSGSHIVFTKQDGADWTLPANQDHVTDDVWLTRGKRDGLFNIANESGFQPYPPEGTEWAFGSAADWQSLTFGSWDELHAGRPPNLVGKDAVVHLLEDDIYLDIRFLSWSQDDTGGGFSYVRSANNPVQIDSGPTANPPRVSFAGGIVNFSVIASDGDDDPLTYEWDFGDGTTGSGADVDHQYAAPGRYDVTVDVSDGSVTVRGSTSATVNAPPVIDSGPTADQTFVMLGEEVAFEATASDPNDDEITYSWDFGDGETASGSSATHTYAAAGAYTVTLTVADDLDETPGTIDLTVANRLTIAKLKGKLNFKKPDRDKLLIKGELDLPGFVPAGKELRLDAGGVEAVFTLDPKGKAKTETGSVKLKYSKKKRLWTFKLKLKTGSFAEDWADEGFVDETMKKVPATLRATVVVGGVTSLGEASLLYSAKTGRWGKFK